MSFSFIERNLATVGLSGRNDAALSAPLDVHDDMQPRAERRHRDQPGLAVVLPPVLENQRLFPIHAVKVAKIDPVVGEILEPLVLIPRRHTFL